MLPVHVVEQVKRALAPLRPYRPMDTSTIGSAYHIGVMHQPSDRHINHRVDTSIIGSMCQPSNQHIKCSDEHIYYRVDVPTIRLAYQPSDHRANISTTGYLIDTSTIGSIYQPSSRHVKEFHASCGRHWRDATHGPGYTPLQHCVDHGQGRPGYVTRSQQSACHCWPAEAAAAAAAAAALCDISRDTRSPEEKVGHATK